MRVHMTVVSRPANDRDILDGGSKTLTNDPIRSGHTAGYGRIVEYPNAIIAKQSEEHGQVDLTGCPESHPPDIGERVTVIPNHACGTGRISVPPAERDPAYFTRFRRHVRQPPGAFRTAIREKYQDHR